MPVKFLETHVFQYVWLPDHLAIGHTPGFMIKQADQRGGEDAVIVHQLTTAHLALSLGHSPAHDLSRAFQDAVLAKFQLALQYFIHRVIFLVATAFDEGDKIPTQPALADLAEFKGNQA